MDDQQLVSQESIQTVFFIALRLKCLGLLAALVAVGGLGRATESCTAVAGRSTDRPANYSNGTNLEGDGHRIGEVRGHHRV